MIKHSGKCLCLALAILSLNFNGVFAGNKDRAGQAGASELLINPWAKSAGWGGVNVASVRGMEASFLNVAGTAFVKKTEVGFTYTKYLKGSDINISSFGFSQKLGASSVITISLMSMSFGDIQVTTTDLPEGGLGTFSPQYLNFGLSYAKAFSNSIYGGITLKGVSESITDVKASGICFDAGIMYLTGTNEAKDNLKFGITLKNVGTPMTFSGDGLSFRSNPPVAGNYQLTVEQRAEKFEIPSLVDIGVTYDWQLAADHTLSTAVNFISNSFSNDQYGGGVEYTYKKMFSLRTGYVFESKIGDAVESTTTSKGLSAGFTAELPLGKSGKSLGLDYSYSTTRYFDGTHRIGVRLAL
ncbi:MAG: PorV/PorQ family protein [Bacteroidia bacterium]